VGREILDAVGGGAIDLIFEGISEDELGAVGHGDPFVVGQFNVEFSGGIIGSVNSSERNMGVDGKLIETGIRHWGGREGDFLGIVDDISKGNGPSALGNII